MKRHLNRIALIVVLASGSTATLYGDEPDLLSSPEAKQLIEEAQKQMKEHRKDYDEAVKKTVDDIARRAKRAAERLSKANKPEEAVAITNWLSEFKEEVLAGRDPKAINPVGNKQVLRGGRNQQNPAMQGAILWNKHFYKVIFEAKSWKQAEQWCRDNGGHLVTIENAAEQNFLVQGLLNQPVVPDLLWIGATDEKAEGQWLWVDGAAVNFPNWKPREPDNAHGIEHYAAFSVKDVGAWTDRDNAAELAFICEWDK